MLVLFKTITEILIKTQDFFTRMYSGAEVKIVIVAGIAGGIISKAVGGFDKQLYGLLIFMLLDYLTGMYAAYSERCWCSTSAFRGLIKKVSIIVAVAFCYGVDTLLNLDVCRYSAIAGFGIMEAMSIIENADRGGWGEIFPFWIRDKLKTIKTERLLEPEEN